MEIIQKIKSPHYRKLRLTQIDTIVIHYISCVNIKPNDPFNVTETLKLLTEPIKWGGKKYKVSAHYCITRDGVVYQLVDDSDTAWHSGKSELHGRSVNNSCNDFSIGIELIGGDWVNFTGKQYKSLVELTHQLRHKYDIPDKNIVGHEDIAPKRKTDPGKHFNWDKYFKLLDLKESEINKRVKRKTNNNDIEKEIKKRNDNKIKKQNNISDGRSKLESEKNEDLTFLEKVQTIKTKINNIIQRIIIRWTK